MNKPARNGMDIEFSFFNSVPTLFKINIKPILQHNHDKLLCTLRIDIEVDKYHDNWLFSLISGHNIG